MDNFCLGKSCPSPSQMADARYPAFDRGTGGAVTPMSLRCSNTKNEEGSCYPPGPVTLLSSNLWNKTIPYDPDLKVALEFMDLEEFLNENSIQLDDRSRHCQGNNVFDSDNICSRIPASVADMSCSLSSLTSSASPSSACNSPAHRVLHTPPRCSPSSLHDSNSSTYYPLEAERNFVNPKPQLIFEDSNDSPESQSLSAECRSQSSNDHTPSDSYFLHSPKIDPMGITRRVPNSYSPQSFMKSPQFPCCNEYSVDFRGVTLDQSSCRGESPSALNTDLSHGSTTSVVSREIIDLSATEKTPGAISLETLRVPTHCSDSECWAPAAISSIEKYRRKTQGRAPRMPSTGIRNRRRSCLTNNNENVDDILAELDNHGKDTPEPQHVGSDDVALSSRSLAGETGEKFNPRTRRFSEDELKPLPMAKKSRKQYVLPDLKDDKYWARRQKNNVAAKRSRDARRIKENQIALRASYLEEMHATLRRQLDEARTTISDLQKRLAKYEPV